MIPPDAALINLAVVPLGAPVSQLPIMGGMTPSNPAARMTKMAANRSLKV